MTERREYRYYEFVMVAFVVVLICSNLVGPAKIAQVELPAYLVDVVNRVGEAAAHFGLGFAVSHSFVFGAGVLFFPISYVFGDILTEVYGYARSRRVIWMGFGGLAFASLMSFVVVSLPPAPFWKNQAAYEIAFGLTWRIALASMVAYFCGEFVNSYVLARMKIWTGGRWLWTRTIGSTILGEGVDSLLFYPLAFYDTGIIPNDKLPLVMVAQFVTKVGVEVVFTPVTYAVVGWLKRNEHEDYYDRDTRFTPFTLRV